jgi:hypothetical protein
MAWDTVGEKKAEVRKTTGGRIVETRSETGGAESARQAAKDLRSGMELLEPDFLLSIVENTTGIDPNDVAMRRLTFDELLRRKQQDQIDSKALTVYAVNEGSLYGKTIQCEAIKELTKRTAQQS